MPDKTLAQNQEDARFIIGGIVTILSCFVILFGPDLFSYALGLQDDKDPAKISPANLCAIFLVFHNARVWLGITFLENDKTFLDAFDEMREKYPRQMQRKKERHFRILILLYGTTLPGALISVLLGFWGFAVAFAFQSIGLIFSDLNWKEILIYRDRQKSANKFIIVGDCVICVFAAILLTFAGLEVVESGPSSHIKSAVFLLLWGALLSVFSGEIWSQYAASFKHRWNLVFSRSEQP